jgi:hypothetical protein
LTSVGGSRYAALQQSVTPPTLCADLSDRSFVKPLGDMPRGFFYACRQSLGSGRVQIAHAETYAPLPVDFEHLDAYDIAFLELVADSLYALV